MRRKIRQLILLVAMFLLSACSSTFAYLNEMPNDFEFSVTYGVEGKQKVDTFTDTVVKDLVIDGTVEATIPFTKEEMIDIYNKMVAMKIMNKLDIEDKQDAQCHSEPEIRTEWNIQMNGEMKNIRYTMFCKDTRDSQRIIELQDYIHSIVMKKEEYQKLPESNGYYK